MCTVLIHRHDMSTVKLQTWCIHCPISAQFTFIDNNQSHLKILLRFWLNWLSVDQLLFFRATVMTYKCMNHLASSYLSSKFVKRSDIHNRRTRNREALQIPFFRSASGQRSFAFRGARLWNNISPELRQCASLKAFKEKLKSHILANSY